MNNRIVTESSAYIKQMAKESLKGNWLNGTIGVMLFYLLTITVRNILNLLVDNSISYTAYNGQVVNVVISGNLYDFFTTPIFTFGLIAFTFVIASKRVAKFDLIFSGFEMFVKVLVLSIVMAIKIILWGCLFVIPGIIAALNYSQAYYILFEDPTKGPMQCIRESIAMMKNNKGNLFYLLISFIGWMLVASIGGSLVLSPLAILSGNSVISPYFVQIIQLITMIPIGIVMTYLYVAQAHFHQLLKPIEVQFEVENEQ